MSMDADIIEFRVPNENNKTIFIWNIQPSHSEAFIYVSIKFDNNNNNEKTRLMSFLMFVVSPRTNMQSESISLDDSYKRIGSWVYGWIPQRINSGIDSFIGIILTKSFLLQYH